MERDIPVLVPGQKTCDEWKTIFLPTVGLKWERQEGNLGYDNYYEQLGDVFGDQTSTGT
jgi:hypothetical protein